MPPGVPNPGDWITFRGGQCRRKGAQGTQHFFIKLPTERSDKKERSAGALRAIGALRGAGALRRSAPNILAGNDDIRRREVTSIGEAYKRRYLVQGGIRGHLNLDEATANPR